MVRYLIILLLAGCNFEQQCKDGIKSRLDADCRGNGCLVVPSGQKYMACYIPPLFFQTCDPRLPECQLSKLTCTEVP